MISREVIKAEVEKVPEERLEELYLLIKNYAVRPLSSDDRSLMTKLRSVEIDGPEDFAQHLDLYLNGEKTIG